MSTKNHPYSILRAMQNATDAEIAAVARANTNLTFNEQMYTMIKRLEADVRLLKERIAALEKLNAP